MDDWKLHCPLVELLYQKAVSFFHLIYDLWNDFQEHMHHIDTSIDKAINAVSCNLRIPSTEHGCHALCNGLWELKNRHK